MQYAGGAQAIDRIIDPVGSGAGIIARGSGRRFTCVAPQRQPEMGTTNCQRVEGDIKKPVLRPSPLHRPDRSVARGDAFAVCQQQLAITISPQGIEHGVLGLPLLLPPLGLKR
jgi:hypothetical protein